MIDIHTHIIPGLDDGPETLSQSLELINILKNEGIDKIVATPHFYPELFPESTIENRDKKLNELKSATDVDIFPGFEVMFDEGIPQLNKYTMNNTQYILVEFSRFSTIDGIFNAIKFIHSKGLHPIIAHIERYTINEETIEILRLRGASIQMNADFIVNNFRKIKVLITKGLIDFVASDIHPFRELLIKKAYDRVKSLSDEIAERVFMINPQSILSKKTNY